MAASSSSSPSNSHSELFPMKLEGDRLYLLGQEEEYKSYAIAISTIKSPTFFSKFFDSSNPDIVAIHGKIKGENVQFNINITTVSKQLGLQKSQILEIAKKVNGLDLLKKAAIIHHLLQTHPVKEKYKNKTLQSFKFDWLGEGHRYFIDTRNFNAYQASKIGSGSFGKVFRLLSVTEPGSSPLAIKKAKRKVEGALEDLEKEGRLLQTINPGGKVPGIQRPPIITDGGIYLGHLYHSDLSAMAQMPEFQKMPTKDKLLLLRQLIVGLIYLHQSGYFHGDIKPLNCLMEMSKDAVPKISNVVLSDFGGVQEAATWNNGPNFAHTPDYLAPEIVTLSSFPADAIQSSDVYALSKTIVEVLLDTKVGDFISVSQYERLKAMVSQDVAQVFMQGMSYDRESRPSAKELLIDFDEAIRSAFSEQEHFPSD